MRKRRGLLLGVHSFYEYQKAKRAAKQAPTTETPMPRSWMDVLKPAEEPQPAPRTDILRPEFRRRFATLDANEYWDIGAVWNHVANERRNPVYRGGPFVVDVVTLANPDRSVQASEMINFFRIPQAAYQGLSVDETLRTVLLPFLEEIERSVNSYKPYVVPGLIRFEMTDDGALILTYYER